jgi:hypothetical protein
VAYIAAQTCGALAGAELANALLGWPHAATQVVSQTAALPGVVTGEIVATAGLMTIVFGCARSGRAQTGPFAVGAWLVAIAVAVPSAFVNPALTAGAWVAAGPVALTTRNVLIHLPPQCVGALLAFVIVRATYPTRAP